METLGLPTPVNGSSTDANSFPVVAIGASAGGLDACKKLLKGSGNWSDAAFILVQHLDPTHNSMLAELLAGHTSMTVLPATNGMMIERNHLYIIPPGKYLSVGQGALRLSKPQARHGARLPVDHVPVACHRVWPTRDCRDPVWNGR